MAVTTKIILLFLSLILAVNIQSVVSVDIGNKKIVVTEDKGNWYQAHHACTALGMSLLSIESDEETLKLRDYLLSQKLLVDPGFWLSGTNLAASDTYTWLDSGKKFSYTKWQSSQPSGLADQCVYASGTEFAWRSDSCNNPRFIICSRPLIPSCGITGRCKRNKFFFY